jgi:hypothetical protein
MLNNNASSASSSWLLPIEQRISSVQKETEELKGSNRKLSRQLLLLRSQNAARRSNRNSDLASAAPASA